MNFHKSTLLWVKVTPNTVTKYSPFQAMGKMKMGSSCAQWAQWEKRKLIIVNSEPERPHKSEKKKHLQYLVGSSNVPSKKTIVPSAYCYMFISLSKISMPLYEMT